MPATPVHAWQMPNLNAQEGGRDANPCRLNIGSFFCLRVNSESEMSDLFFNLQSGTLFFSEKVGALPPTFARLCSPTPKKKRAPGHRFFFFFFLGGGGGGL